VLYKKFFGPRNFVLKKIQKGRRGKREEIKDILKVFTILLALGS